VTSQPPGLPDPKAPGEQIPGTEPRALANQVRPQSRYKQLARRGVIALGVRSALQQVVILVANVYLVRTLARSDYGLFGILNYALQLLYLVGDGGLAAALIQKDEQPSHRDLSTIWWLQLTVASALVAISFGAASVLPLLFPDLPDSAPWMFRGLSLALLFTMLRSTPFLLLERELHFRAIGALEFAGTIAFYGTAVALAATGAGATALVVAAVGQAAVIAIGANLLRPFRPAWVFDWPRARHLVRYGVTLQGTNVIGFISTSSVAPILVGSRMGTDALGIVHFAQNTAWFPTAFLGVVRRVSFPFFSRLQSDRSAFAREYENSLVLCALPVFVFVGLLLGTGPSIVEVVYSAKWSVAVPVVYVYAIILVAMFQGWVGGAALEALGHVKPLFKLVAIGAVINWAATIAATLIDPSPFAFAIGFAAHAVFINGGIYLTLRRLVPEANPLPRILRLAGLGMLIAVLGRFVLPHTYSVPTLILWAVTAVALYGGLSISFDPQLKASLRRLYKRERPSEPGAGSDTGGTPG
jgi:O-antigen/teichoic acid export membrane protein